MAKLATMNKAIALKYSEHFVISFIKNNIKYFKEQKTIQVNLYGWLTSLLWYKSLQAVWANSLHSPFSLSLLLTDHTWPYGVSLLSFWTWCLRPTHAFAFQEKASHETFRLHHSVSPQVFHCSLLLSDFPNQFLLIVLKSNRQKSYSIGLLIPL